MAYTEIKEARMEYSLETQRVFTSTNFRQYRLKTPTMNFFTQLSRCVYREHDFLYHYKRWEVLLG